MSTPIWFEQFKEKLQGFEEDFATSHSKVSMLAYAIQTSRISSEEYLSWAMTQYRLPRLQSRFFIETPPSQEMFAKWATHYLWSAECLPVAEWDGSLIVACLQPPQDFPSSISIIPVLTTFEDMENLWRLYHKEEELNIPHVSENAGTPEGIDLSMATVVHANKSDSFSFEDLGVESDAPSEPSHSEESSEHASSEEVAQEDKLEGLIFDGPTTIVKLETVAGANPLFTEQAEQAEQAPVAEVKAETKPAPVTLKPTTPEPELTFNEEATRIAPATPVIPSSPAPAAPVVAKAEPVIPPPPQKKVEEPKVEEKTTIASTPRTPANPAATAAAAAAAILPINPMVKSGGKVGGSNAGDSTFRLEALKKKNSSLDERVKTTFEEMKTHFEKAMILTMDEKESQLIAFAWDENFKGVRDQAVRVSLRLPSIFNIVASTQKPFHGYISLNEINEKFFEDWNQGRIPDHVTITPLIVDDKMVGMLMGFAEKSAYNKMSLGLAERLSNDFVKNLKAA